VWVSAASQIFYSLGIGWGTLPAFASYNQHHHNFTRDAWVVPLINCGTSFLAGIVVFAVLGNMSVTSGVPIDDMEIEGSGLAFVVYPAALAKLPASPVFAFLFFLMLLCLGLDTQFSMVSGSAGGSRNGWRRRLLVQSTWGSLTPLPD
jgi:SNF family Na+-dependent transporter